MTAKEIKLALMDRTPGMRRAWIRKCAFDLGYSVESTIYRQLSGSLPMKPEVVAWFVKLFKRI